MGTDRPSTRTSLNHAPPFNESTVERAALEYLARHGVRGVDGDTIEPESDHPERSSFDQVVLRARLRAALERLNTHIPASARAGAVDETIRRIERTESYSPLPNHAAFHKLLIEGVDVSFRVGAELKHDKVWLADFDHPAANDWLAVQQFTVTGYNVRAAARTHRLPDAVFEFKNAAAEHVARAGSA